MGFFDVRGVGLPYCLKMQACGRYVLLNRKYKPLGFYTREDISYSDFPMLLTIRITPTMAANLSCQKDADVTTIFLYDDGCVPIHSHENWESYGRRLRALSSIRIDEGVQLKECIPGIAIRNRNLRDAKKTQ